MRASREQIIESAIQHGAEFVIDRMGRKSVSTKEYRAAAPTLEPGLLSSTSRQALIRK